MEIVSEDIYENFFPMRNEWFGDFYYYMFCLTYDNYSGKSVSQLSQDTRKLVYESSQVSYVIRKLSQEEGIPEETLWQKAHMLLFNMGHNFYLPLLRSFSYALSRPFRLLYGSVLVNSNGIRKVLDLMKEYPVLLMVSHRSYSDFIFMPITFNHLGFSPPAGIAGDNLSQGFLGSILHSSGAIFIRRSMGKDTLYRTLLNEYIHKFVRGKELALENFVEGGRSRTSLPLKPKNGILSIALETYFFGMVNDIALVPVSISYDRILEERNYAQEELGAKKKNESFMMLLSAFFQMIRGLEPCGKVYVHYCKHIMMSSWCHQEGYSLGQEQSGVSEHDQKLSEEEKGLVEKLGWRMLAEQHKHMRLSVFAVTALALGRSSTPVAIEDLRADYYNLKDALRRLGVRFYHSEDHISPDEDLEKALRLHSSVVSVSNDGMVHLAQADTQKLEGKHLKSSTLEIAMVHLLLQHEKNKSLSYLVRSAALVLALQHQQKHQESDIQEDLSFLLDILSDDFVLLKLSRKDRKKKALEEGRLLGLIQLTPKEVVSGTNVLLTRLLSGQLGPFLTSYAALAVVLEKSYGAMAEEEVVDMAQVELERMLDNGDTQYFSSLSRSVLRHGLEALIRLGAATQQDDEPEKSSLVVSCTQKAAFLKTKILSFIVPDFM